MTVTWLRVEFWWLVLTSLALPLYIVVHLLRVRDISRWLLLAFSLFLLLLSGLDIILLKDVMALAQHSRTLLDDTVFLSEYSLALYLLPLLAAGLGINLLSHVITQHLRIRS
ncbi:MAG: hypothetical protein ACRERR_04260 [Moraxellaceae bacterium]